jgi:hypothetical protein
MKKIWEALQILFGALGLLLAIAGALYLIHDCSKSGGVMAISSEPSFACLAPKK